MLKEYSPVEVSAAYHAWMDAHGEPMRRTSQGVQGACPFHGTEKGETLYTFVLFVTGWGKCHSSHCTDERYPPREIVEQCIATEHAALVGKRGGKTARPRAQSVQGVDRASENAPPASPVLYDQRDWDAIDRLARSGAHIVLTREKRPVAERWQTVPATQEQIRAHSHTPEHMVGMCPYALGLLLVDVDCGIDGRKYEGILESAGHVWNLVGKPLIAYRSRNGGMHMYYRVDGMPDGFTRKNISVEGIHIGEAIWKGSQGIIYAPTLLEKALPKPGLHDGKTVLRQLEAE